MMMMRMMVDGSYQTRKMTSRIVVAVNGEMHDSPCCCHCDESLLWLMLVNRIDLVSHSNHWNSFDSVAVVVDDDGDDNHCLECWTIVVVVAIFSHDLMMPFLLLLLYRMVMEKMISMKCDYIDHLDCLDGPSSHYCCYCCDYDGDDDVDEVH